MIYFIITTSLIKQDYEIRKKQYINGITAIKTLTKNINCKLCIVENNGQRRTFLDDFGIDVLYTNNNEIKTNNKGIKELKDVWDSINHFNIQDNDFLIKITGRYILQENTEFLKHLDNDWDCIIKYGNCQYTVKHKVPECLTVLVGLKSKYVKKIKVPEENECVEWCWARSTFDIPNSNIIFLEKLGILVCPGSNNYILV